MNFYQLWLQTAASFDDWLRAVFREIDAQQTQKLAVEFILKIPAICSPIDVSKDKETRIKTSIILF